MPKAEFAIANSDRVKVQLNRSASESEPFAHHMITVLTW